MSTMATAKQHARPKVIHRRPAETLTGTAALAAFFSLFASGEKAAAFAGLVGLVPAVITFVVAKFGTPFGPEAAARRRRDYAPALDAMYSHLSSAVGGVLAQPKTSLATIDRVAGMIGRLDPRLAGSEPVPHEPLPSDEGSLPELEDPEVFAEAEEPEQEGGVVLDAHEPPPRRRRRAATPARERARPVTT
jgi:hypothetical protein